MVAWVPAGGEAFDHPVSLLSLDTGTSAQSGGKLIHNPPSESPGGALLAAGSGPHPSAHLRVYGEAWGYASETSL